jgi:3-oxoadipate enol-lactonase
MAALHLTLDRGTSVLGLGLLATTAGGAGLTWPTAEFIAQMASGDPSRELDAEAALALGVSEDWRADHSELFAAFAEYARTQARARDLGEAQMHVFLTHDVAGRLEEISVPTVVICGTQDPTHPPANSEFLASHIPHARLVQVEGAGHLIHVERPNLVIDEITFLARGIRGGSDPS